MAVTQLGDVIEPSVFQPYMIEQSAEMSRLFRSGAVQQTDEFDEMTSQKGKYLELPFFKDLGRGDQSGGFASQAHTDDTDLTINARSTGKQRAVKHRRADAWGSADLVESVIDEDPLADVANRIGEYWANEIDLAGLFELNALFKSSGPLGSNATDPHYVSVGAEDGTTDSEVTVDGSSGNGKPLLDAMNTLGDRWGQIVAIAMHSKSFKDLQLANLIDFEPLSEQEIEIPRFMGRDVIVDDNMPFTAGTDSTDPHDRYTTYLFGQGAFAYGEGAPQVPFETERDATSNGGQEKVVSRRHFALHPNGIKFSASISGDTPTQSELETASNYSLEYDHKNVAISAVEHN